ncbi:hypothetical protein FisN_1Hh695 [Fistulifera solaris]|uniref:Uncharacterized protein n=1 Tax=Fistulifera solaris TaxID=1519565 RepID=A0A1Z5JNA4_FISSO|nr:hypothetical protein FisN_1Hh695 [Fistulifera solaris]|eukprot:GAX15258.1 hypothetical protein FisN_1Hh695 [Fistulifera solaris]
MIYSRFFAFFALFAFASAGRFLEEEADPCLDGTETFQESVEYSNATDALYAALDEFEANATGVCVVVDGRTECKGALSADVLSTYEESCATMGGNLITVSNMRITCDFPDTGNIYTVIETFHDCVASVCTEDSEKDLKKELTSAVDEHKEGDFTYCFVVEGESSAFSAFSVGAVFMSLAALFVL